MNNLKIGIFACKTKETTMKMVIIIAIFTAIAGWFITQSDTELANVFDKNHDDMHWIASAAMTCLIFFIIAL